MSAPPSSDDDPQGETDEDGLPRWQQYAVGLLTFIVVFAGTAFGPALVASVALPSDESAAVTPDVPFSAPNGPTVTVTTQTDINGSGLFPQNDTVDFGPLAISGPAGAAAAVSSLNGTWTNLSSIATGGGALQIDPNDKQRVTLSGGVDTYAFRQFVVNDGKADFVYGGPDGTATNVTLRGLPASTQVQVVDQQGTVLAVKTTDASGTMALSLSNSQHVVYLGGQGANLPGYYDNQTGNVSPIDDWLPDPTAGIDAVGDLLTRIGPAIIGTGDQDSSGTGLVGVLLTGLVFAGGVAMAVGGIGLGPVGGVVVGLTMAYAMPALGLAPAWLQPIILFLVAALAGLAVLRAVNS